MSLTSPTLQKKDLLDLISNLATMLAAGIPILEAVDSLREESKGAIRRVLNYRRACVYSDFCGATAWSGV